MIDQAWDLIARVTALWRRLNSQPGQVHGKSMTSTTSEVPVRVGAGL